MDAMENTTITNEVKRHTVIVSIKAKHSNLEIAIFLRVARSFVFKVRKELNENNGGGLATSKGKQRCRRSDSLRTPEFVRKVHYMMDENPGKSMRHLAIELQVSEGTIRNVVHQDLGHKSPSVLEVSEVFPTPFGKPENELINHLNT